MPLLGTGQNGDLKGVLRLLNKNKKQEIIDDFDNIFY